MQSLSIDLSIPIPSDLIVIQKVKLEHLKKQELSGTYWSMQQLEKRINRKNEWIKENILYRQKFRSILDVKHGGFVYYPERRGQSWSFQAKKMAEFLDNNFTEIHSE
ncbi:DUF771 domain-containing protein [Alkalihalophilus marmarensis]|uniref:DUF771 domain-containing protein n=1 Tax=Alkalihalophilus marmarensis TaxID=521377 RepID=UPI002E211314|nr:DUF771 domain-containing protein [Alkalihalophilus marmarensis]